MRLNTFVHWVLHGQRLPGISRSTLYLHMEREGIDLTVTCTYSQISNNDLDHRVVAIKQQHPNDGGITGHLYRLAPNDLG